MDIAIIIFLAFMIVPALFVTLYIRRLIRLRQDATHERRRQLEAHQRKRAAALGNPKSVTRRAP